ncbi:MAG: metallophosphoesterase, partial [Myxococcota bacterium]|nr:metallophosphoesterase [Myxococcota bacterium]
MPRTLFVGDVHGCADELASLLRIAAPSAVVLLGDVFTKGPDPAGVWALIASHGAVAVLGNHDAAMLADRKRLRTRLPDAAWAWLDATPLMRKGRTADGRGWRAVHAGVHPRRGAPGTSRSMALNLRRFPDDRSSGNPFWWSDYRRKRLVIHGHDARRGLVDRRPWTLGLDTGCVYGGALTGYLL